MRNLTEILKNGIPEFSVPPTDPLVIDRIVIADLREFRATAINVTMRGLWNYQIHELRMNFEDKTIWMNTTFSNSYIDSLYDVRARLLVNFEEKGMASFFTGKYYKYIVKDYPNKIIRTWSISI